MKESNSLFGGPHGGHNRSSNNTNNRCHEGNLKSFAPRHGKRSICSKNNMILLADLQGC